MTERQYLLNIRSGVLHYYPAFESCNIDDSKRTTIYWSYENAVKNMHYKRDCKRCAPS